VERSTLRVKFLAHGHSMSSAYHPSANQHYAKKRNNNNNKNNKIILPVPRGGKGKWPSLD